jgi:hypothetical protein
VEFSFQEPWTYRRLPFPGADPADFFFAPLLGLVGVGFAGLAGGLAPALAAGLGAGFDAGFGAGFGAGFAGDLAAGFGAGFGAGLAGALGAGFCWVDLDGATTLA